MRLTFKITLLFIGGICVVMAWHGLSRIDRETELLETQMRRHHYAIAQPLAVMVGESWDEFGESYARSLVASSNEADERVRIRWIWTDAEHRERIRPEAPDSTGAQLAGGMAVSWIDVEQINDGRLYTYVPVVLEGDRVGALELSESLERQEAYLADSMWRIIRTTILIILMATGIAWVTGLVFIARPVEALIERARAIGRGELDNTIELHGQGELTVLAREMNLMSHQLLNARRALEEETTARISALQQLRHADRLKTVGTLSAGLAHELGTPLNVISMRSKMIENREVQGEKIGENAAIITTQAERISKIIRKLVDFARIGSLDKEKTPVDTMVEEACELVEPMADNADVQLHFDRGDQPLVGLVDPEQLVQVMINLLVNAIHACQEAGGGEVHLRVRKIERIPADDDSQPLRSYVAIEVEDDGVGIAEEYQEQIFEPFFTTKDVGEGSGLGLSVSYGIVREHGGWIEMNSQPGQGAKFTVVLPRQEER